MDYSEEYDDSDLRTNDKVVPRIGLRSGERLLKIVDVNTGEEFDIVSVDDYAKKGDLVLFKPYDIYTADEDEHRYRSVILKKRI